MPPATSRRALLRGFVAVGATLTGGTLVAGCRSGSDRPGPTSTPDPDRVARAEAAATEDSLRRLAAAVASRHPSLSPVATPAAAAHAAHAAALRESLPSSPAPSGSTPAATTASPGPAVPATAAAAATALARAEDAAAAAHLAGLGPVSGSLARLLASVAGSDAAFASLLRGAGR